MNNQIVAFSLVGLVLSCGVLIGLGCDPIEAKRVSFFFTSLSCIFSLWWHWPTVKEDLDVTKESSR